MNKKKLIKFIDLISNANTNIKLDKVSIENYKLIKNVIQNLDENLINLNHLKYIVKKSNSIIIKMYENFISFKNEYYIFNSSETVSYPQIRKELFNFPSFNETVANDIKNEILKINKKYYFTLIIKNIKINLYFYSAEKDDDYFKELAKIVYLFVLTFGFNSSNFNVLNQYKIRFLLIDFPRKLDSKNQTNQDSFKLLSEKGIFNNSSGVNMFRNKELVVTRKSGINGLLIHELIHMLGLDFCYNFNDNQHINIDGWEKEWVNKNNIIDRNNNIKSFIESICNTTSSYFLSIYNSIVISSKIKKPDRLLKYFKYFYYLEAIYCYINSSKLINYFNFDSYDSIFNNTNNKIYYQNALVFEYVVLRMFLISNYYKFLLSKMLKYNFNEKTNSNLNFEIQNKLNKKMINLVKTKKLKDVFDSILKTVKNNGETNIYMEYFLTNLI